MYLGCKLDLKQIALNARNAEYNPKRFAAVIMRIREPRTTALIFSSGKMVCTGAKSEEQARLAARKYARIIQKLGFEVGLILSLKNTTVAHCFQLKNACILRISLRCTFCKFASTNFGSALHCPDEVIELFVFILAPNAVR